MSEQKHSTQDKECVDLTPERKRWIDEASIEMLLRRWRFGRPGDPMFMGDCGTYYKKVMCEKRDANPGEWVAASKLIGW